MNVKVVSCLGPGGWEQYGKKFVETFVQYWPATVHLHLYYHDEAPTDPIVAPNVEYINLLEVDSEVAEFRKHAEATPFNGKNAEGEYNYRMDSYKFCHKVFATTHATFTALEGGFNGYLIWLDGDTFTTGEVTEEWLQQFLPAEANIVHLPRKPLPYSETSFVGFNFGDKKAPKFLADLRDLYVDKEIYAWREWHDGYIFSRLLYIHERNGLVGYSLTPPEYEGIDAFANSRLAEKLTHLKGNLKNKNPGGMQQLKIIPQDSMPKEHILNNANVSDKLMPRWLRPCHSHSRTGVIVSAGPSLLRHIEEIRQHAADGAYIACVKHSLPILMKHGIVPDACIILDPRPVDAVSTHGVLRTTLFDDISPKTTFFIASMTDTSVTELILSKTSNVVGWFAWTQSLAAVKPPVGHPIVVGGTCSAWRALGLLRVLGFQKLIAYGFDFVMDKNDNLDMTAKDDKGRPKYLQIFIGEGDNRKPEITTGELAAGIQDVPALLQQIVNAQMDVKMVGEDGAAYLWNYLVGKHNVNITPVELVDFSTTYQV